jgi:hypothetical protein
MVFIKKVEDFVCEHCGTYVEGSGYTNHCPKCLWSKHVDNHPGDRAATCGGMMEPVGLEGSTPNYRIQHKCERCGKLVRVTASANDDPEALLALAQKHMP